MKHGTCAAVLPELGNENKYFGQGLAWLQQYSMSSILAKAGILPDQNTTVMRVHKAVREALNHNPSIHCIHEKHTGDVYLSEIRVCFNKQLELVDCDGVVKSVITILYPGGSIITNCDISAQIKYPSVVPKFLLKGADESSNTFWKFPLVNFYKLVQLLKWFTL